MPPAFNGGGSVYQGRFKSFPVQSNIGYQGAMLTKRLRKEYLSYRPAETSMGMLSGTASWNWPCLHFASSLSLISPSVPPGFGERAGFLLTSALRSFLKVSTSSTLKPR